MTNRDYDNRDLGDIFEPTHRDGEPTFSFEWFDVVCLGAVAIVAGLTALAIIY